MEISTTSNQNNKKFGHISHHKLREIIKQK